MAPNVLIKKENPNICGTGGQWAKHSYSDLSNVGLDSAVHGLWTPPVTPPPPLREHVNACCDQSSVDDDPLIIKTSHSHSP